jgi:hypothetical protein
MKKSVIFFVALVALSMASQVMAQYPTATLVTDLIAGNPNNGANVVGTVSVWEDLDGGVAYLYVRYDITEPGWPLTQTHLQVALSASDIPQKNGNAIPGQFDYSTPIDSDYTFAQYAIPLVASPVYSSNGKKILVPGHDWTGKTLYIAAHGVAGGLCDVDSLAMMLPEEACFIPYFPAILWGETPVFDSYFDTDVESDPGNILNGLFPGWCLDRRNDIYPELHCPSGVYSSYDTSLPLEITEKINTDNIDLVNWILNQGFPGNPSDGCGDFTSADVQLAIWILMTGDFDDPENLPDFIALESLYWRWDDLAYHDYDDDASNGYQFDPEVVCRVNQIISAAETYGEGFVPGCGQSLSVILVAPDFEPGQPRQLTIVEVELFGHGEETVWGNGYGFPGNDWSMYFTYTPVPED